MFSKPKRSRFSQRRKSVWPGKQRARPAIRLSLETLEDRLAPATGSALGSVHFAVIGDYGAADINEQAVANLVKSWNPQFIVTAGDNNYEFGGADTIDQNIGQYYSDYIYPYKGTYGSTATSNMFWPVLGNHDWETTGAAPYLNYFTLPGNGRYYKLTEGPVDFFMVDSDSHEPDGNGQSSVQGAWLQAQLSLSTAPWKIVVFHHPPYSSGTEGSSSVMQWSFKNMGASAVISGHDHDYERFDVNGIPYFVNGPGGAGLAGFPGAPLPNEVVRDGTDYGAMLVDASASQITYQFINTAGIVIDSYTVNFALPAAPVNLNVSQVSPGQANLTWTDSATNELGYDIERSTDGVNFSVIATVGIHANQYMDSAVTPGMSYSYRVDAFNVGGNSSYTNTANMSALIFTQDPYTPTGLGAAASGLNQISLGWTENSPVQSFSVERSSDGSNYTQIATVPAGTTSYLDSGLASSNYFYRIRAIDFGGSYTPYSSVVVGALAPNAPSGFSATPVSSQQVNLSWAINSSNETGFAVWDSTDGINYTQIGTAPSQVNSFPTTGLASASTYYFKVTAFNSGGSASSGSVSATTNLAPPANPSNLTATALSASQVNLTWTDNSTVPQEDGFKIYRTTDDPSLIENPNWAWAYTAGQNATSYSITGLNPGTNYFFYIKAYNVAGQSGPTNTANAATFPLPLAPSNLTATAATAAEIDLSWTNTDPTSTGTKIYKSSDGVNFLWSYTMAQGVTSYAVTGLTQTSTYYFYIASFNGNGTSPFTSTVSATTLTLPAAPSNLTSTAISSSQISLAWTNNAVNPPASSFAIYQSTDGTNFTWSYTVSATSSNFTVTSLASLTTYYFKVAAINQGGSSGFTNASSATTQAAPQPPQAPSGLAAAVASASQINLSWTNNDSNATGSKIYKSTDGVNYTWAYTMAQGVSTYSVTGLSPSTTYYFKVVAYNSVGNSAYSNTGNATTMPVPAAPTNPATTVPSSSQINLSWTNNDSSATGTKIYKSTDGVNFTWSYTVGQGVSSYSVTGLSASTTYYFKVAAYNSAGTSAFSAAVNATTMAVPAAPSNLTANGTSSSQIALAWTNNAVNPAATNIAVYKSTDGVNFSWSYTLSPTATSYNVTGLSASTTYYFRIRAYNGNGTSGYTNTSSATTSASPGPTSAPAAPSGLSATGVSSSQINLAWTSNSTNQNGFNIQRSLDGTTFTTIATVGVGLTSYSVTGLSASTTYYFQVSAYNPIGTSAFSNSASGTTSAGTSELSGDAASSQEVVAGLGQTLGWSTILGAPAVVGVYIDNSDGSMTPAQQARIADAVVVMNATWDGTNGLQLVLVSDPSQAGIIVHNVVTTPVGGVKDGVLGDTEISYIESPDGQMDNGNPYLQFSGQQTVDIVEGWNWYARPTKANNGMTAINPNQYDYESVVVHELGHAVGLYHDTAIYGMLNSDGYSTMNPLLFAGQTHRQLSDYDVAWLNHVYAYGASPGTNEAPSAQDALRAWWPASEDSMPSQSEPVSTPRSFSNAVASTPAGQITTAPLTEAPTVSPASFNSFVLRLGGSGNVSSSVDSAGFSVTSRGEMQSQAIYYSGSGRAGEVPAVKSMPSSSATSVASTSYRFGLAYSDPTSGDTSNQTDSGGLTAESQGQAMITPTSSGRPMSRISIWEILSSTNETGLRQDGNGSESDMVPDVTSSLWELPGASDSLDFSSAVVLALIPGVTGMSVAFLDRSAKSREEETERTADAFSRKNRIRP